MDKNAKRRVLKAIRESKQTRIARNTWSPARRKAWYDEQTRKNLERKS